MSRRAGAGGVTDGQRRLQCLIVIWLFSGGVITQEEGMQIRLAFLLKVNFIFIFKTATENSSNDGSCNQFPA